jgi:hypothetical protein
MEKMFSFQKKQYCIENAIKICPVMEKKNNITRFVKTKLLKKIWCTHEILHFI